MGYYRLYYFFLLLRFLFVFSNGYIHPDEFFQSDEVMAKDILNCKDTYTPWEFQNLDGIGPCRTIIVPFLSTGIPFMLLSALKSIGNYFRTPFFIDVVNGYTLLYTPRFFLFCVSLLFDLCIIILARNRTSQKGLQDTLNAQLLTFSSCWVALVFSTRTFSNTIESIILAVAMTLTLRVIYQSSSERGHRYMFLGALVMFGAFTRFTFLFFYLPFGIFLLIQEAKKGFKLMIWNTSLILLGASLVFSSCVLIDSLYFGTIRVVSQITEKIVPPKELFQLLFDNPYHLFTETKLSGHFTLTPLNGLMYNLNPENLALHGTHFRGLHLLVNTPLLFAPIPFFGSFFLLRRYKEQAGTPRMEKILFLLSSVSGLFFLSLAPHQEPRFLIPLLFPLTMVFGEYLFSTKTSNYVKTATIAFNLAMSLFFGMFHQGGVVPTLLSLPQELKPSNSTTEIVFWKTYMPPRFLLCTTENTTVHDLMGVSNEEMELQLKRLQSQQSRAIFLVAPSSAVAAWNKTSSLLPSKVFHSSVHVDPDNLPTEFSHWSDLLLHVYQISNKS